MVNNKRHSAGKCFDTEKEAALAYNELCETYNVKERKLKIDITNE